jgi:phosphoribosylaminoimidazole-succinocarboxamide synthase
VTIEGLTHLHSGKVRDLYDVDDDHLLLVASDRVSTYDVVHPTPIPDKGRVLTALSRFWFDQLASVVDNHLVSTDVADLPPAAQRHADELRGRVMLCRKVEIVLFECVVRGYLVGSGWTQYQQTGTVSDVPLPAGLDLAEQLPAPIFTPTTKAQVGEHDEPVGYDAVADTIGPELAGELRDRSLALYEAGAAHAARRAYRVNARSGQLCTLRRRSASARRIGARLHPGAGSGR